VPDDPVDKPGPAVQVDGWRTVRTPPEHGAGLPGQRTRAEAEFDERPHPDLQQRVEQRVDVLEVVDRCAVLALGVHEHVVVEEAVEPDVLEPAGGPYLRQLPLPVRPQPLVRPAGADHPAPVVVERLAPRGGGLQRDGLQHGAMVSLDTASRVAAAAS
jgi:hypothetical protein